MIAVVSCPAANMRQHLVAQLPVGHALAGVLVARRQQHVSKSSCGLPDARRSAIIP